MASNAFPQSATRVLHDARDDERAGRVALAIEKYRAAIDAAVSDTDVSTQAEALRRLSVVMHRQHERGVARELCLQSFEVASALGDSTLAAEALNTLGCFELEAGEPGGAGELFLRALTMARNTPALIG
ncbi:MAG: tetratricopeptide repeat protein, partial [Gemmatimonadota bacterium]